MADSGEVLSAVLLLKSYAAKIVNAAIWRVTHKQIDGGHSLSEGKACLVGIKRPSKASHFIVT